MVESNKEYGDGRSDVVVKDQINGRVAVFEAKYTRQLEKLENECDEALKQIENQMYAKQLEEDYDEVLCYGIAFFKKRCMVKIIIKNEEKPLRVCSGFLCGFTICFNA